MEPDLSGLFHAKRQGIRCGFVLYKGPDQVTKRRPSISDTRPRQIDGSRQKTQISGFFRLQKKQGQTTGFVSLRV